MRLEFASENRCHLAANLLLIGPIDNQHYEGEQISISWIISEWISDSEAISTVSHTETGMG